MIKVLQYSYKNNTMGTVWSNEHNSVHESWTCTGHMSCNTGKNTLEQQTYVDEEWDDEHDDGQLQIRILYGFSEESQLRHT